MDLTVSLVSGLVGVVTSILLQTVPKLKDWWKGQPDAVKRLGWLIGCLVIPLVMMALVCVADIDLGVVMPSCDKNGWVQVILIGGSAYLGGQGSYAAQRIKNGKK